MKNYKDVLTELHVSESVPIHKVLCELVELLGYKQIPYPRKFVKVYQIKKDDKLIQVEIPNSLEVADYKEAMLKAIDTIKNNL